MAFRKLTTLPCSLRPLRTASVARSFLCAGKRNSLGSQFVGGPISGLPFFLQVEQAARPTTGHPCAFLTAAFLWMKNLSPLARMTFP